MLPLQLRQIPPPKESAVAWFLTGGLTARWLEELARCGLAGNATRLYAIGRGGNDSSPAGLLIVPVNPAALVQAPTGIS